jgi:hypothetical protein
VSSAGQKSCVLYKSVERHDAAQQEEPQLDLKFLFVYFQRLNTIISRYGKIFPIMKESDGALRCGIFVDQKDFPHYEK